MGAGQVAKLAGDWRGLERSEGKKRVGECGVVFFFDLFGFLFLFFLVIWLDFWGWVFGFFFFGFDFFHFFCLLMHCITGMTFFFANPSSELLR